MSMSFTVQLNDPNHFSQDAALVANVSAAAADWSRSLNALGSIDIQVDVAATSSRASGGTAVMVFAGTDGARNVFEHGSAYEMRTAIDPNGSTPDIVITVDPSYLQNELWLDPDPAHPSSIPSNKTDGVSVFRHEIAHAFGIAGYRDRSTGSLPNGHESVWDKFVQIHSDGSAWFVGPSAKAVYGGDVPVTTLANGQQYFHIGNGSDGASQDLMNGILFSRGTSYHISALDLAIMRDLALPLPHDFKGGPGNDMFSFNFNFTDARVSFSSNHVIVDGPSGSRTVLTGFKTYVFTDGTVNNNDGDPLVDDLFYYSHNRDVWNAHVDADQHYHQSGWREGRDPNGLFSTSFYLSLNQDVKQAGADLLAHFDQVGWWEGRDPGPNFDTKFYLMHNPDVAGAGVDPLAHFLQFGLLEGRVFHAAIGEPVNGFDAQYYLIHNPDVAAAGVDPLAHFNGYGWREGRNPNALFDTKGYLAHYFDVAAAGASPLAHYEQFGWKEGRDPSTHFDTLGYLAANPDVAAAGVNPLDHYLTSGIYEGRTVVNDGLWG